MIKSDIYGVSVLIVLYGIQGILLTLFTSTFPLILGEKGYTISQLSYLNMTSYPFSLKIFFAPFLDTYFSKSFGQRKSYIVPTNYIAGIILLISSYFVSDWINQGHIIILSVVGLLLVFTISIQDIATDAWGVTILSKEKISFASLSQAFGMQFGFILANTGYIQLQFNESIFLFYLGIFMLAFNFFIHFFVKEHGFKQINNNISKDKELKSNNQEENENLKGNQNNKTKNNDEQSEEQNKNEDKSIGKLVQTMKGFYYNKNLRMLIFLVIIQNFGVGPLLSSFILKMQKSGISKSKISMAAFYLFPLKYLSTYIIARYFKNSLKIGHTILIFQLGFQVFQFLFYQAQSYNMFVGNFEFLQICFLVIISLIDSLIITSLIQTRTTFYSTIATKGLEGIYITMLTSVQNVGRKWVISTFQFSDDYLNFNYTTPILWIFQLFYIKYSDKIFKKMDSLDKKEWCLVQTMDNHKDKKQ